MSSKNFKKLPQQLIAMSLLLSMQNALADQTKPRTLRESVLMAISLNPKTKSKDIQIESMHERTLSAKANKYPSGSVSCSQSTTNAVMSGVSSNSISRDCNITGSMTLYDGGSNNYSYLATKEEEEAQRQRFNSTNPFIQNTKGSLANQTMGAYMGLTSSKESINSANRDIIILQNILTTTTNSDDQGLVNAKIAQIKMSLARSKSNYLKSLSDFKYVVTTYPADNLENMEDAIHSLEIPTSADEAVQISLQKNPDVQATNASLRAANDTLLAAKAALGPRVSLVLTLDKNSYVSPMDSINNYSEHSTYAGVQISIPLSLSTYHYTKSQELSKRAAELDRDAALDDAQHGIESAYAELEAAEIQHDLALKAYNDAMAVVQATQTKIINHDPTVPSIQTCLSQYENLSSQVGNLMGAQSTIVVLKFTIQQLAGTVFDKAYEAREDF